MHIKGEQMKLIIIKTLVFFVLVVALIIIFKGDKRSSAGNSVSYDPGATKISEQAHSTITIPCWENIVFEAGKTEQRVNFYNPSANAGIDFQISLYVGDTLYYESGLIAAGNVIKSISIKEPLAAQATDAYLVYNCYTKDGVRLNGSKVNFTLNVENYNE